MGARSRMLIGFNLVAVIGVIFTPIYTCAPRYDSELASLIAWALHSPWEAISDMLALLVIIVDVVAAGIWLRNRMERMKAWRRP